MIVGCGLGKISGKANTYVDWSRSLYSSCSQFFTYPPAADLPKH